MTEPTTDRIVLEVNQTSGGALQLQIAQLDEGGCGHGYRLAGPKYCGDSTTLLVRELDERDAAEIRAYLDAKFPPRAAS